MAANKNLPIIIAGIGAVVLLLTSLSGGASNPNQSSNPDPVNHPGAVLINGVWRDSTHYYNPNTKIWVKLSSGSTVTITGKFQVMMPETNGFGVISYLKVMLRMTSEFDKFNLGDKVKISHEDYINKSGKIIRKFTGEDGENYLVVNVAWNFLSSNIVTGPYKIPFNIASGGGTLSKTQSI
jgi:hypothetical protein